MNEQDLIDKLRRIQALVDGATSAGERAAAESARARVEERLAACAREDPPREFTFRLQNAWSRRLFVALLRRYGLQPYRYPRQRRTTVMVRVPERFCNEVLWPEFCGLDETLRAYLDEVAERVIAEAVHPDGSEVEAVAAPRQIALS